MERPNLSAIGKIIKEKWNCTDHHLFSGTNSHDQYHPSETPWNINKNYTCSFCKRQFKSAQALGGHMNVHRRERARLRLFSPLTLGESCSNNNYNPNPSPKFSSLSSSSSSAATPSAKFLPHNYIPHDHSMLISPPPLLPPPAHHHHHPLTSLSLPDHDHRLASTEKDMNKTIFDFPGSGTTTNIPLITTSQGRMKDMTTKSMKAPLLEDGDLKCYSQQTDSLKAFTTENNIIRLDLEMGLLKDQKDDVDLELRLGSTYF